MVWALKCRTKAFDYHEVNTVTLIEPIKSNGVSQEDSGCHSQAEPFHFLSTTTPEDHVPTAKHPFRSFWR